MAGVSTEFALSLAVVLLFAAVHVFGAALTVLDRIPRSRWLSAAGGVAVAYVFVHLLPELSEAQATLAEATAGIPGPVERHAFLVALVGLVAFYGLERAFRHHHAREPQASGVFRLHMVSYATYNAIVGYLLVEQAGHRGLAETGFFGLAMALHFLVNDHGLAHDHGRSYRRWGRWLLAAAPVFGWLVAQLVAMPRPLVSALLAFLVGAVILNTLKEELPSERKSRFWAFGAGAYAVLLLLAT